jgi:hypothetical protein
VRASEWESGANVVELGRRRFGDPDPSAEQDGDRDSGGRERPSWFSCRAEMDPEQTGDPCHRLNIDVRSQIDRVAGHRTRA